MDTEIRQKHPFLKKYGAIAAIVAVLMILGGWAFMSSGKSSFRADRSSLTVAEVIESGFNDYIRISGRVETGLVVQVSALETGIAEQKLVEEGAMVRAGDIILTLNNPNLRQQILDSESQLAEKQNMLRDTEIEMEKDRLQVKRDLLSTRTELNRKQRIMKQQESLYRENLTSREEYLQAKEDYQLALENLKLLQERLHQDSLYRQVQIAMMRESLHNMQENFSLVRQRADNLNVRASHSGQLGSLTVDLGQNVSSGQQVGQINILDNYKIAVKIDEHYIDRIEPGLRGTVDRNGESYAVSVRKVYPEVESGTFRADLSIDGKLPENIRVGQTYYVDLRLGETADAVLVPRGAFFQSAGGHYAYVLDEDGERAVRRQIRIGRQNPEYYEVLEGLKPGERIITSSYKDFGEASELIIK